jgi:hypothetical protein
MTDSSGFFVCVILVVRFWFSRQQTADFGSANNRQQPAAVFVLFGWF